MRYPLLCSACRFCGQLLRKNGPEEPWVGIDPDGDSPECGKAPNPEEGPMPNHEPGAPILEKPLEPWRIPD